MQAEPRPLPFSGKVRENPDGAEACSGWAEEEDAFVKDWRKAAEENVCLFLE